jgi:peptidoglycan/xylan/chitin deacetylase (PgdA/CDA1 family)
VRPGLYFFYFHDISEDEAIPATIRTSPTRFEAEANYIWSNFEVLSLDPAVHSLRLVLEEGKTWNGLSAVICFDDGFRSVREQALPVLAKLGCPSCIFVNGAFVEQTAVSEALIVDVMQREWAPGRIRELFPDFNERQGLRAYVRQHSCREQFELLNRHVGESILAQRPYLSLPELAALPCDLVIVANHTYRHLLLSNLSREEQELEILENHALLQQLPNYQPVVCIPFGSDDSFDEPTKALMIRHNHGLLMKAVGGIDHHLRDGLIEIERIGMNNNKAPIAHHVAQRTENTGLLRKIARKVLGRFSQTAH